MTPSVLSRRAFSLAAGSAVSAFGVAGAARSAAPDGPGVSHTNDAIHQAVVFKAAPDRVYHVLTDPKAFEQVVLLSGAIQAMALKAKPVEISPEVGGPFSLFGGYITGRHLDMTPGVRLIQVWQSASWPPHSFSIVRFELTPHSDGTKLVFDHNGFPNGAANSLAHGWQENYWAPMTKVLA